MFPFLSDRGVLGLNARNLLYIKPFNPKKAVAFADDKLKTKAYLSARDIPTAKIFARIENRKQLRSFDFSALPDECVLKPNYGFGGEGIIVLQGRRDGVFLEQGKTPVTNAQLSEHIEDILDGKFSVNGELDTAFFEQRLVAHESLAPFRPVGLPDVRIVVFNLVPVMAMLRVPTLQSRGKANVHLGGIGIGIDIAKGITTHATQFNRIVHELPHGGAPGGIPIAYWEEMLLIASRIQYITNIGYLAVDLTIDQELGPVLLEVNARAGLMVQVANLAPLRARLERIEGLQVASPEKGVRIAQELFGQKVELEREEEEERPVLGLRETITISGEGTTIDEACVIRPSDERTVFSQALVDELLIHELVEPVDDDEDSGAYRVKFALGGRKLQTAVRVGTPPEGVRVVIGRRDLHGFLLDPTRMPPQVPTLARKGVREDLRAIDKFLGQVDRRLLLLKYLKPVNLREERARLLQDAQYNPLFQYAPLDEVEEMEERLLSLSLDPSALGTLLEKKRRELLLRLTLLRARGDAARFTAASHALFGAPDAPLLRSVEADVQSQIACDLPVPEDELLGATDAAALFTEVLERYSLHDWQVSVRTTLVADCTVGAKHLYLRQGARFSRAHIDALIAHEIEAHVLCAENGAQQPYLLFRQGCANYLQTQEGLAIYSQNRILSPYSDKRFSPARSILGLTYALEHSFAQTRAYLHEGLGYNADKALTKTMQLKRGLGDTSQAGAFTKVIVYFRGLHAIEDFVRTGGDIRRLYVGKVALEDLALVEAVPGLLDPVLLPTHLREKTRSTKKRSVRGKKQ